MDEMMDEFAAIGDGAWNGLVNAGFALLIAVAALIVSGWARRRIARLGELNDRFDPTLARFFGSVVKYLILVIAAIFILDRFGVQTTSLAALLGAAGLAVGLALQGTLGNLASGVLLIAADRLSPVQGRRLHRGSRQGRHGRGNLAVHDRTDDRGQCADHHPQRGCVRLGHRQLFGA